MFHFNKDRKSRQNKFNSISSGPISEVGFIFKLRNQYSQKEKQGETKNFSPTCSLMCHPAPQVESVRNPL